MKQVEKLLGRGFYMMPVWVSDKKPASSVVTQTTGGSVNPEDVARWLRRPDVTLGVVCGTPLIGGGYLLVVDVDDKGEEENGVAFGSLWASATGLRVRTGRGRGEHLYFRVQEPFVGRCPAPSVDSRCWHQYVVAPGSRHPSGRTYEIIEDGEIGWAPPGLVHLCKTGYSKPSREYAPVAPSSEEAAWRNYRMLMTIARKQERLLEHSEAQYAAGDVVHVRCLLTDHESSGSKSAILPPTDGRQWSGYRCWAGRCDGHGTQAVLDNLKTTDYNAWRRLLLGGVL